MSVPPPPIGSGVPPTDPYGAGLGVSQDDKSTAMIAHLLGIFTGFLGPLIIWLLKKDQSKFIAFHSLQALFLNVAAVIASVFFIVPILGQLLFGVAMIARLVFGILACLAANRGEWYEIPVVGKLARQNVGV